MLNSVNEIGAATLRQRRSNAGVRVSASVRMTAAASFGRETNDGMHESAI